MDDDWSKINPLTELEAINAVKNYIRQCSLVPTDIDHSNNKEKEQSPDLLVRIDENDFFLCEIKTPGHYFDPIMNLYLWKNVYDRLRDRLRTARKQFENYDPDHNLPRVVIFTSNHPQLNFTHCQYNILGRVGVAGQILQDFRNLPEFKFTEKNKRLVDMILWCQINRHTKEILETEHFINLQSKQLVKVREISKAMILYRRYSFEY